MSRSRRLATTIPVAATALLAGMLTVTTVATAGSASAAPCAPAPRRRVRDRRLRGGRRRPRGRELLRLLRRLGQARRDLPVADHRHATPRRRRRRRRDGRRHRARRARTFTDASGRRDDQRRRRDGHLGASAPSPPGATRTAGPRERGRHARASCPPIVWRDLSTHRDRHRRRGHARRVTSHGPKVIPPGGATTPRATATGRSRSCRSQYTDRAYQAAHDRRRSTRSSTTRPSGARRSTSSRRCRSASSSPTAPCPRPASPPPTSPTAAGFDFTPGASPASTCTGVDLRRRPAPAQGTPLYPERITDGVYQPARQHRATTAPTPTAPP